MILAILITGCQNNNKRLESITIAQAGDFFLYAPLYVAVDAKIFEKKGYDVKIISTGGDEKTWAAVLSNSAQFGIADPSFIAISNQNGQPGKVIASIVNGVPFWGITFRDDIPTFDSLIEIKNYKIATFPAPSTAYSLQKKMFLDLGLKPNIREGAFGTIIAMLKSNQADIGLELEPNVSQSLKNGAHIVYSLAKIYGDFAITGLTVSPNTIQDNPKLVQNIVDGLQESLSFIHDNRDSTLSILHRRFPEIDLQVAEEALNRVLNENIIPDNLLINDDAWDKAVTLRKDIGDLKEVKDFGTYVNNSFAKKAILDRQK